MDVQASAGVLVDDGLAELAEGETPNTETTAAQAAIRRRIAWDTIVRCAFLTSVFFLAGVLAWRPGVLRFSSLMSLANPSRGESLNWKPVEDPLPPLPERRGIRQPAEWRLAQTYSASWNNGRPPAQQRGSASLRPYSTSWRRYSANPWHWQNDAGTAKKRSDFLATPAQKPESPFRAGAIAAWPISASPAPGFASSAPAAPLEGVPPLPPPLPAGQSALVGQPPSPSAPASATAAPARAGGASTPSQSTLPDVPFIEFPARLPSQEAAIPGAAGADKPVQSPELPAPSGLGGSPFSAPVQALSAAADSSLRPPTDANAAGATTPETVVTPAQPERIDWANNEITGPIPGAYLTIYPKLRFIGLCVPGQGYVRKYNQVGVPRDLTSPKQEAMDGRTPYGKYYIASRTREADGPRLFLSWPSPDDAKRLGLDAGRVLEVESAWQRKALPPQTTTAGGGIGLDGLRGSVDRTDGGFSLEEPHIEEIFTALPDGAWVFIQEQ